MTEIEEKLLTQLKCCVCFEYLSYLPIFVNSNGESMCGRCPKLDVDDRFVRDTAYERLATIVKFPCIHENVGCHEKFGIDDMSVHEDNCLYRKLQCPANNKCDWAGKCDELVAHYTKYHSENIVNHPCTWKPVVSGDNSSRLMTTLGDFIFLVTIEYDKSENCIYHNVKFMGDPKMIKNFKFRLEINNETDSITKYSDVKLSDDFMETDMKMLKYLGEYENISFKLT